MRILIGSLSGPNFVTRSAKMSQGKNNSKIRIYLTLLFVSRFLPLFH